jgi:hypothetical protein
LPDGRRNSFPRWGHRTRCPYRIISLYERRYSVGRMVGCIFPRLSLP